MKKLVAGAFALFALGALTSTANASEMGVQKVSGHCGEFICTYVAHENYLIQDVTVTVRAGSTGVLRAWHGPWASERRTASRAVFDPGYDLNEGGRYTLACGGLERGGREIEVVCARIRP